MAFELAAGHAVNNLGLANFTFAPRDVADFSVGLEARDGPQTVNIFIDASGDDTSDYQYAASVVEACVSHTVYALQCTAGSADICGSNVPVATVTENASEYSFSSSAATKTAGIDIKATAIEHCVLGGTTAATCTATAVVSASGQSSTATAVTTYTDASTLHFDVTITGGNDKLANPTGKCSSSAAPSVNTRAVALWGFLGAIGAASVLAF
ncbi:hypothetical protein EV127DRAFT_419623 [Xylaria flabelliformis]|nr:hypothetical protein EV127DRAFT_419623 [Xylaria flabelliformis]